MRRHAKRCRAAGRSAAELRFVHAVPRCSACVMCSRSLRLPGQRVVPQRSHIDSSRSDAPPEGTLPPDAALACVCQISVDLGGWSEHVGTCARALRDASQDPKYLEVQAAHTRQKGRLVDSQATAEYLQRHRGPSVSSASGASLLNPSFPARYYNQLMMLQQRQQAGM